jgi:predicted component of type VI protein secretion system
MTIGRFETNAIVLDDVKVSRRHARVIHELGVTEIEDMESNNGVLLNGRSIDRRVIRPGDEIEIGQTRLRFVELPPGLDPAAQAATQTTTQAATQASIHHESQPPPPLSAPVKPISLLQHTASEDHDLDQENFGLTPVAPRPTVAATKMSLPAPAAMTTNDSSAPNASNPRSRNLPRRKKPNTLVLLLVYVIAFALFTAMAIFVLLVMKQKDPDLDIYRLLEWLRETFPDRFPR